MTNEAAERLRRDFAASVHDPYFAIEGPLLLDAALAAERRATVERIRAALQLKMQRLGGDPAYDYSELAAILDAEAERSWRELQ